MEWSDEIDALSNNIHMQELESHYRSNSSPSIHSRVTIQDGSCFYGHEDYHVSVSKEWKEMVKGVNNGLFQNSKGDNS